MSISIVGICSKEKKIWGLSSAIIVTNIFMQAGILILIIILNRQNMEPVGIVVKKRSWRTFVLPLEATKVYARIADIKRNADLGKSILIFYGRNQMDLERLEVIRKIT